MIETCDTLASLIASLTNGTDDFSCSTVAEDIHMVRVLCVGDVMMADEGSRVGFSVGDEILMVLYFDKLKSLWFMKNE